MAAGIVAAKSLEARRAALEEQCVALEGQLAERDEELAFMAGRVADLEAARAGAAAPAVTSSVTSNAAETPAPAAKAAMPPPPVDPAAAAWAKEDVELSGLAIYSREPGAPETGSRRFWREQVDRLGRHLLPDATPGDQLRAALRDGRGKDFVLALQSCLN